MEKCVHKDVSVLKRSQRIRVRSKRLESPEGSLAIRSQNNMASFDSTGNAVKVALKHAASMRRRNGMCSRNSSSTKFPQGQAVAEEFVKVSERTSQQKHVRNNRFIPLKNGKSRLASRQSKWRYRDVLNKGKALDNAKNHVKLGSNVTSNTNVIDRQCIIPVVPIAIDSQKDCGKINLKKIDLILVQNDRIQTVVEQLLDEMKEIRKCLDLNDLGRQEGEKCVQ